MASDLANAKLKWSKSSINTSLEYFNLSLIQNIFYYDDNHFEDTVNS